MGRIALEMATLRDKRSLHVDDTGLPRRLPEIHMKHARMSRKPLRAGLGDTTRSASIGAR
jgi:hypothetical protein